MCCRTNVQPLDREIAETILAVGQFKQSSSDARWVREIEEEGTVVTAWVGGDALELSLSPSVTSLEGHHHKRIAAGVMYEIAARYAEKVNGIIKQTGINVPECMNAGDSARVVGNYPEERLSFERTCIGWQSVFLGEVEEPASGVIPVGELPF